MASPIAYISGVFKDISLGTVDGSILWDNFGAPRSEAYYATRNIPYTYGKGAGERTYHPHVEFSPILEHIRGEVAQGMELLFCNRYADQHQHLGWHADDSPSVDASRPIVVVTFGAEREIWFRANGGDPHAVEKLKLEHGSVLVMHAGMQQTHQHRIPKHDRICGARVSLTFRGLTPGWGVFEDE